MSGTAPEHYFRIRANGAVVFRIDRENARGRLDLVPIAVVNTRTGEIRPRGAPLDEAGRRAIESWLAARTGAGAAPRGTAAEAVERLNLTAQWAQSKATSEELDAVTDDLLLAMHDLRTVLVRKAAARLRRESRG